MFAEHREEAAEVYGQAHQLGLEALTTNLSRRELCSLCRTLSSAGYLLEKQLLEAVAKQVLSALASGSGVALTTRDWDDAAGLALTACEVGQERGLGAELVEALCTAGAAATGSEGCLSGSGAAALALAAAAGRDVDAPLLDALLTRCSEREMDLSPAGLGDIRLACMLAGHEVVNELQVVAAGFLRTVCSDVPLDDPRGAISATEGIAREEALTVLEGEVSEALNACEVTHSRGSFISGAYFPFTSHVLRAAFCTEEPSLGTAYRNAPAQRTAWQRWRCRVAAAAGWRIFAVSADEWNQLGSLDERLDHMRRVLLQPLNVKDF